MIPADFETFFATGAAVVGALVGLLFVAISVAPGREDAATRVETDIRAGIAFSALVNALAVCLIALIPGTDIGWTALVVGLISTSSCIALGLVLVSEGTAGRPRRRQVRLLAVQALVFLYEAVAGFRLVHNPHAVDQVHTVAALMVALFLIGIARAWQLVGARDAGLLTVVLEQRRARHTTPDSDEGAA